MACIPYSTLGAICLRAHSGTPPGATSFTSWTWPVPVVVALLSSATIYTLGASRMWLHKSHAGLTRSSIACFAFGWLSLAAALDSPIHELGEELFFVHMIQHEILMLISAPLLLLGRPSVVFLWALSPQWRRWARWTGHQVMRTPWTVISAPVAAWCVARCRAVGVACPRFVRRGHTKQRRHPCRPAHQFLRHRITVLVGPDSVTIARV